MALIIFEILLWTWPNYENSVFTAIESYEKGIGVKRQIFEWSEILRVLQEEVADLAIELIARYQPVAGDLRFIRSCMEISYGFSRLGRYSYDIVDVFETMGYIFDSDKAAVLEMAKKIREMLLLSRCCIAVKGYRTQPLNCTKWMIQ